MDARRFDRLTKSLAARLTRRGALRQAGAAASAGLLASAGLRPGVTAAQEDQEPVYGVIRRYSLAGPASDVRQALQQGYLADACNAPGFIAYFAVEDEDGDFSTVAVFRTQDDFDTFANAEASWIAQNLGDLLPSPDEAISGASYVHVGAPDAFRNTCPGGPAPDAPTAVPAPTTAPAPTAAPAEPTPVPQPACTGQGCVCITGTQAPCDDGLVCCPTTDRMGGPGICQTENVCHPSQCTSAGNGCPATCNWGDACPGCCSNYCNDTGQCDDPPAPCTGMGCACTTGIDGACDIDLICCGTTGAPVGPGTCLTEAECHPVCPGDGCYCDFNDPNACDPGLVCCAVQSGFICASAAECGQAPCTAQYCDCIGGAPGTCDAGLICCVQGDPGAPGKCQTEADCPGSLCTGQDCECAMADPSPCQEGLICCGPGEPDARGTCQPPGEC